MYKSFRYIAVSLSLAVLIVINAFSTVFAYSMSNYKDTNYRIIWDNDYSDKAGLIYSSNAVMDISKADLATYRDKSVPNAVQSAYYNLPKDVNTLTINANCCGIVLEKSESNDVGIYKVGFDENSGIEVSHEIKDGVFNITAEGKGDRFTYVNISDNFMVNTVNVKVPSGIDIININTGTVCSSINSVVDSDIYFQLKNGSILLNSAENEYFNKNISIYSGNGNMVIDSYGFKGGFKAFLGNGDIISDINDMSCNAELSSGNGNIIGDINLINGNTSVYLGNGDIFLNVGSINNDLDIKSGNGDLKFNIKENPSDLKLECQGRIMYPKGWKKDIVIGNGKPVLKIMAGNGQSSITIGNDFKSEVDKINNN